MNLTAEQLAKVGPDHPILTVIERLGKVEEGMLRADPELPTHLKMIWKEMQQYEELAHLLTPEQIGVLTKGLQKYTAVQLVTEAPKRASSRGKKPSVDDLI
jgi:hypothetical protein